MWPWNCNRHPLQPLLPPLPALKSVIENVFKVKNAEENSGLVWDVASTVTSFKALLNPVTSLQDLVLKQLDWNLSTDSLNESIKQNAAKSSKNQK